MINLVGQRVRMLRNDGPLKTGWEGTVDRPYGEGSAWEIRWDISQCCIPTYDAWFEVIDETPDETESYFV